MMGYVEAASPFDAVRTFFDNPQFPLDWRDIRYMWAEPLQDDESSGHYGEFDRIYIEDLAEQAKRGERADSRERGA
jgi:hypothetical protein